MLSVITTTYNCSSYISQAVHSILNQTYKDFEYLIVDDGSNDNTEIILYKINDERIRYIRLKHIGRAAALNYALNLAKYETIALMDADDISHPLRFEKQIELVKNNNQFIFCDTAYFSGNKIKYIIKSPNNSFELKKKLALHGHFNNSSSLFNKNHVLTNGGFNEKLKAYEDYELWLRLKNISEFKVLPHIYHFVRLRQDSMTTSNPSKLKHIIHTIQEPYFNDLSRSFGITNIVEQNNLKGCREFFYGSKSLARKYLRKITFFKREKKIKFIFILSYLPNIFLEYLKKNRFRLRLEYTINQFRSSGQIQREFDELKSKLNIKGQD